MGGDAPVSIQSMTTTKTADINATLQQIASLVAAGVDIVRVAVPHWEDAEALDGDRGQVDRAGGRRHPFPVEVRDGRARSGDPGTADQPGQHQVPGQGARDRARGEGAGRADPDRRERRLAREGSARSLRRPHPRGARRVRPRRGPHPRGRGLLRHQDLGEALEPAGDDRGVPAARGEVRLPVAPRGHRGGADADGRGQERRRDRDAARRGDRRHDPRLAHGRSRSRRSRSARRSCSRSGCGSAAWISSPARPAVARRSTCSA